MAEGRIRTLHAGKFQFNNLRFPPRTHLSQDPSYRPDEPRPRLLQPVHCGRKIQPLDDPGQQLRQNLLCRSAQAHLACHHIFTPIPGGPCQFLNLHAASFRKTLSSFRRPPLGIVGNPHRRALYQLFFILLIYQYVIYSSNQPSRRTKRANRGLSIPNQTTLVQPTSNQFAQLLLRLLQHARRNLLAADLEKQRRRFPISLFSFLQLAHWF